MTEWMDLILFRLNYIVYALLMVLGLYGVSVKKNFMKKIIGLNIFQTAIILFFISAAAKKDATLPILIGKSGHSAASYINPLPHVLMLTAIVVAVATLGVALGLAIKIFREFGTVEEDRVTELMSGADPGGEGHDR